MRRPVPNLRGSRLPAVVRAVLLVLCITVAVTARDRARDVLWAAPMALLAATYSLPLVTRRWTLATCAAEGLLTGLAIGATGLDDSPYLPYLIAPAFAGGLTAGLLGGVAPLGTAAAALLVRPLVLDEKLSSGHLSSASQWVVLSLLVAAVASWIRAVLAEADVRRDSHATQQEALRLLTQLRDVARELPGTLDPASTGEAMLGRARALHRFDQGSILVAVAGSRQLTVLARVGGVRPQWDLSLASRSPLTSCWRTQRGMVAGHRLARAGEAVGPGSLLVAPLVAAGRTLGLIVLESGVAQAFSHESIADVTAAVEDLVLQLQTALLFDEVRELATHEERRRLAREIHDGIAQELASLGYALDSLSSDADGAIVDRVGAIRGDVTRLVSELRMSLFDLRSDIAPDEGLGAAIGRHVRAVGSASGMTVHLSLNEAPVRLAAETEAELLRIVQEAVANARKHAHAGNLWVTCTVDPPGASISVEDDGLGLPGLLDEGGHGLAIMQERATRIRASVSIEPRHPRGTRVSLSLGG